MESSSLAYTSGIEDDRNELVLLPFVCTGKGKQWMMSNFPLSYSFTTAQSTAILAIQVNAKGSGTEIMYVQYNCLKI